MKNSLALLIALINLIRRVSAGKRVLYIAARQKRPYNLAKGD